MIDREPHPSIHERTSIDSLESFRYLFSHPLLTRAQEDVIFSLGQPDSNNPEGTGLVVPRNLISTQDLQTHPQFSAFLGEFSEQDRQRSEEILGESQTLTEYLVRHYQKRVAKITLSAHKKAIGISEPDLFQEGNMALSRAINTYDPLRKSIRTNEPASFSTFSNIVINNALNDAITKKHRKLGIPLHVVHAFKQFKHEVEFLGRELGKSPTENEIRYRFFSLGTIAPDLIDSFLKNAAISEIAQSQLQQPVGFSGSESIEIFPSQANTEDSALTDPSEATTLSRLLTQLPEEERSILIRRGIDGGEKHSLRKIGEMDNISHELVRRIEVKALRLLKQLLLAEVRGEKPPAQTATDHDFKSPFREQDEARRAAQSGKIAALIHNGSHTGEEIMEITGATKNQIYAVRKNMRKSGKIPEPLSPEERRAPVLEEIAKGKTDMQIAIALNKPVRSVITIRKTEELKKKTSGEAFISPAEANAPSLQPTNERASETSLALPARSVNSIINARKLKRLEPGKFQSLADKKTTEDEPESDTTP